MKKGLLYAKGPTAKQLRSRRRREIKAKDRQFQEDMPPDAKCLINKDCLGQLVKHHRKSRRFKTFRWDNSFCWILCVKHHGEIESLEEKRFCEKYGLPFDPV